MSRNGRFDGFPPRRGAVVVPGRDELTEAIKAREIAANQAKLFLMDLSGKIFANLIAGYVLMGQVASRDGLEEPPALTEDQVLGASGMAVSLAKTHLLNIGAIRFEKSAAAEGEEVEEEGGKELDETETVGLRAFRPENT